MSMIDTLTPLWETTPGLTAAAMFAIGIFLLILWIAKCDIEDDWWMTMPIAAVLAVGVAGMLAAMDFLDLPWIFDWFNNTPAAEAQ